MQKRRFIAREDELTTFEEAETLLAQNLPETDIETIREAVRKELFQGGVPPTESIYAVKRMTDRASVLREFTKEGGRFIENRRVGVFTNKATAPDRKALKEKGILKPSEQDLRDHMREQIIVRVQIFLNPKAPRMKFH
ncbi:hypothetical protein HOG17_02615 [Candidatus Peregrinibacteria bacterium]|jgi:hypothetical protein|nr:hypothetical protein [Candidatus Peregrinibacteria bacterium]MBT4147936.1 hypothetical protein [Candidatus Peregrinibacteria bacterium]MBT4456102.1 hypothetical protein [Candidatus Peregrinibacteria bacterium]